MHIPFSTFATTALLLAAGTEAAPHHRRPGGRPGRPQRPGTGFLDNLPTLPTGFFGPGGGFRNRTRGGRQRTRSQVGSFPTLVLPTDALPTGIFPTGVFPTGVVPTGIVPTGAFPTFSETPSFVPSQPANASIPAITSVPSVSETVPPEVPTASVVTSIDDIETISFVLPTGVAVDADAEETSTLIPDASISSIPTFSNTSIPVPTNTPLPSPTGRVTATTTFPSAAGSSVLATPMTIAAGESFDGQLFRFDRGTPCTGQNEGGDKDAVFLLEEGASISNVIIGADQAEGIHCLGSCTITNVWWEDVCEDALTIKQESGTSFVYGGGARNASDKIIQHNGGGTVHVEGFFAQDFGKLYRSCGNCKEQAERHVVLENIVAEGGKSTLVGINTNFGDTAEIKTSCLKSTKTICTEFEGNDTGDEPKKIGTGITNTCVYTEADVSAC